MNELQKRIAPAIACGVILVWLLIQWISGDRSSSLRLFWFFIPALSASVAAALVVFFWKNDTKDREAKDAKIVETETALNNLTAHYHDISGKLNGIAATYIKDGKDWHVGSITASNFVAVRKRIEKIVRTCSEYGYAYPPALPGQIAAEVKAAYEDAVRKDMLKQQQAKIKERIRQEAEDEAARQEELRKLAAQERAIREALSKALERAKGEHDVVVDDLRKKLAEAEEANKRAISQAQLTKAGYVYIISNIGSFGENVFKVGMTRRLEPMDRINELGDASVPFPFDVHAMIYSEDAPALENALHRALAKSRMNKINLRKEFFRTEFPALLGAVQAHHGKIEYKAEPEALEYKESATMTEEEFSMVEKSEEQLDDVADR